MSVAGVGPTRLVSVSRHVLFVNGTEVLRGPVRANPAGSPTTRRPGAAPPRRRRTSSASSPGGTAARCPGSSPCPLANDLAAAPFVLEADLGDGRGSPPTTRGRAPCSTAGRPTRRRHRRRAAPRSSTCVAAADWSTRRRSSWPAAVVRATTAGEPGRPSRRAIRRAARRRGRSAGRAPVDVALVRRHRRWPTASSSGTLVVDVEGPAGAASPCRRPSSSMRRRARADRARRGVGRHPRRHAPRRSRSLDAVRAAAALAVEAADGARSARSRSASGCTR